MSPVLAAALARAEAADALPFDADFDVDFASVFDADVVARPFAPGAPDAAPARRASRTPGRFFGWSGCFGHSTPRGEGRRS